MNARPLATLFACCLVAACGSGSEPNVSNNPPPAGGSTNRSLRFFGSGSGGIDRVKVPLLTAGSASRPVNVGATDFTVEFWIKASANENPTPACTAGRAAKDAWLDGAVVLDRDVLGDGDFGDYALALLGGQVAFSVGHGAGGLTVCGASNVLDDAWHHVAVTRQRATGQVKIFIDGGQDVAVTDAGASLDVDYNPAHANAEVNDPFLVLGAQKRDAITARAFRGFIDELRVSTTLRYLGTGPRPAGAFTADADTAALYHFDETGGTDIIDSSASSGSPGTLVPSAQGATAHRSTDVPF